MTSETGIDRIARGDSRLPLPARFALLTNQACRSRDHRWTGTVLRDQGYRITAFLAPEHGLATAAGAGTPIPHSRFGDIPVLSMYGADLEPVDAAIGRADAVVIDLPDVGCRYYTYEWTAREAMKLAARHGKAVFVLDRPNPLGGDRIEGSYPELAMDSPVCASPVPVRHGMTLGELCRWQVQQLALDLDLTIITLTGWRRDMLWRDANLPWVPPSPALRTPEAAAVYPGTCLFEGTNVSEGRATDAPFQLIGAPFVDGPALAAHCAGAIAGATVTAARFTPVASKWSGTECQGIRLEVADHASFHPVLAGLQILEALRKLAGFEFRAEHFDALAGTPRWRELLSFGSYADEIAHSWSRDEHEFQHLRHALLLYD